MSVAIRIENVSKLYRLGTVGTGTISHDLNRWWHTIRGKEDPYAKVGQINDRTKGASSGEKRETSDGSPSSRNSQLASRDSYVWALKDINLEVQQGEILGIIGRNGAGKSTLLKLLSRVTAPTTGEIKTKGRIASLLEVGTGFHPELTGRENIYMNGSILGMRRHEITRQLDEIVEFSGCAKYLDTPVKRYSSGMTVRLGFAVAAHLQCEILIVDEVLAVGDAEFQKKCLGKMREVANGGRTVLFVSHNMQAVASLTEIGVLIAEGAVVEQGPICDVVSKYLANGVAAAVTSSYVAPATKTGNYVESLTLITSEGAGAHRWGKPLTAEIVVILGAPTLSACLSVQFVNRVGQAVVHLWQYDFARDFKGEQGRYKLRCVIPDLRLYMGRYSVTTWLAESRGKTLYETLTEISPFEINMDGWWRDHYPWHPDECVYLEDNSWDDVVRC
jgi:lipopolysaccharide transport system ATP-binding protein